MPNEQEEGTDITKEQMSDVYTAGTSDGLMITREGLVRIDENDRQEEDTTADRQEQ